MKYVSIVAAALSLIFCGMTAAVTWATEQSQARASCYLHASTIEDCPQPGTTERWIRRVLV